MPTYEYRCPSCGNEFEKFQRMSDEAVAACTACGESAERRISAGAGLLFKGSGFYITDYRSDSYKKAAESDKGGGESKGDKGETKGDAKSEGGSSGKSEKKSSGEGSTKPSKSAPKSE